MAFEVISITSLDQADTVIKNCWQLYQGKETDLASARSIANQMQVALAFLKREREKGFDLAKIDALMESAQALLSTLQPRLSKSV